MTLWMPDFQYIPDSPIETGLEKARQAATRLDEKYADRLAEELAKLGRKVLPAGADPLEIGVDGMIGRAMDSRRALDDLLEKMMLEAAVLGAKEGNSSLSQLLGSTKAVISLNSAWDLANLTVEQWVRTQHWFSPLSLTQGLSATEQNRIRMLVVDYVTNQRPQAWLRDRIVGDTGLYGRQRAETIARTEVTHAFARGNRAAWAGRGVEKVSWRTRVDELVCPICGPLHLQEFDVDSDVIPPAHARCRCWIVPAVDRDSIPELPEAKPALPPTPLKEALSPPIIGNRGEAEESRLSLVRLFEKVAGESDLKNLNSSRLAKEYGFKEEEWRDVIGRWNISSNDNMMASLKVQELAGEYLDVPLSEWQLGRLQYCLTKRQQALQANSLQELVDAWDHRIDDIKYPLELVGGRILRTEAQSIADARKMVELLYQDTQKLLAENGVKEVILYRGVGGKQVSDLAAGDVLQLKGNVLESWTLSKIVARDFAERQFGVYIEAKVPASRVFSTGLNGLGTVYEKEVVVLGSGEGADLVRVLENMK